MYRPHSGYISLPQYAHLLTLHPSNFLEHEIPIFQFRFWINFLVIHMNYRRNSIRSMSSSLSDLVGSPLEISVDNVITIEDLRAQMGSCFTCGVSWTDDHVSLDCSECGGYSSERPCPLCDGNCGMIWKRDFNMVSGWHCLEIGDDFCRLMSGWRQIERSEKYSFFVSVTQSHTSGKARWLGVCPTLSDTIHNHLPALLSQATPQTCAASQVMPQELCARLEQLSARAQTWFDAFTTKQWLTIMV